VSGLNESVIIGAPAERVFAWVDDIDNLGGHMVDRASMPMMGCALSLTVVTLQRTGVGATYRYTGSVLGFSLDFSESVTTYVPGREKVWRTIGTPRLVIIDAYEMRVLVESLSAASSRLTIGIAYTLPRQWARRMAGRLLARPYARWCLRSMSRDASRAFHERRAA